MANIRSSNTFYVDANSAAGTASSFISEQNIKLVGIIYSVGAAGDSIDLYDNLGPGNAGQGPHKLRLKSSVAGASTQLRLAEAPIVFPNGIWVVISGTPQSTLILSQSGSK